MPSSGQDGDDVSRRQWSQPAFRGTASRTLLAETLVDLERVDVDVVDCTGRDRLTSVA
jgi:hypothetical protein